MAQVVRINKCKVSTAYIVKKAYLKIIQVEKRLCQQKIKSKNTQWLTKGKFRIVKMHF